MASDDIYILGIKMTKFGKHPDLDTVDLAAEAAQAALKDGGVTMKDIGVLAAGNLMSQGGAIGQALQKQIGQTGIPVYNVSNACATGATALRTTIMALKAGECEMGLAVGVEKLAGAGLLGAGGRPKSDKTEYTPQGRYGAVATVDGRIGTETMPGVFAQVGMEYGHKYGGTSFELFAKISEKNHGHSTLNPLAAYTKRMSLEEIMGDIMIAYPNTRPMCSANCDGAAAAVVVTGEKLKTLSSEQQKRAIKVRASVLTSDPWQEACQILPDVNTLTRNAAKQAYEQAGVGPEDLDLVELHDCFATAELVHYDNLMLCPEGGAVDFFESGAPFRDGRLPVNVSGGLQSKGHPIAATGIANIWEVCHHLRGEAGDRQIEGAKIGLAHVIGLGERVRRAHPGADRGVAEVTLMHPVLSRVRELVRRTGFDVTRYPLPYASADPSSAYVRRIGELGATVVLDVGANVGQFAQHLRAAGWEGRIVSYEPLSTAFGALSRNAAKDPQWQVFNVALGATKGSAHASTSRATRRAARCCRCSKPIAARRRRARTWVRRRSRSCPSTTPSREWSPSRTASASSSTARVTKNRCSMARPSRSSRRSW